MQRIAIGTTNLDAARDENANGIGIGRRWLHIRRGDLMRHGSNAGQFLNNVIRALKLLSLKGQERSFILYI